MNDRFRLNLFLPEEEDAPKFLHAQEITNDVFSATNLCINTLAMDFPIEVTAKQRKALEQRWVDILPELDQVTRLSCRHRVNQSFFEAVCKMDNLEYLHFWSSTVEDISSITKLQKLRRLDLEDFRQLVDISPILKLKKLQLLSVESSFKVDNYDIIGQMIGLIGLKLGGDPFAPRNLRLKSLMPFCNLRNLKHLDLSHTSVLDKSYEVILEFRSLERLDLISAIPQPLRHLIKANNTKLKAGFFMDYNFDTNEFYEGRKW
jgi:Leucine-rich repeat (LRR) protein